MVFKTDVKMSNIVFSAMRKVNGYSDGETPDSTKVKEALEALANIIDNLENKGIRIFQKEWRQKVITDSDKVLGSDSLNYRCIRSYDTPDASGWVAATGYIVGDAVLPTTYNGFYYLATVAGTSGASEPDFPIIQDETVADNAVTWEAVPDTKPVVGLNYRTYWKSDDSIDDADASAFAYNNSYHSASDFDLKEDEIFIISANIRLNDFDYQDLDIVNDLQWEDIAQKWQLSTPYYLYVDYVNKYNAKARLYPIPQLTGSDGYIVHYQIYKRIDIPTSGNKSSPFPDNWTLALIWLLVSEIQSEYSLEDFTKIYNDKKAKKIFLEALSRDQPKVSGRRAVSCTGENYLGSYRGYGSFRSYRRR